MAFVTVFCVSATFLALMIAFASPIASMLGYAGYESCIMYMGGILALDAVTAILLVCAIALTASVASTIIFSMRFIVLVDYQCFI